MKFSGLTSLLVAASISGAVNAESVSVTPESFGLEPGLLLKDENWKIDEYQKDPVSNAHLREEVLKLIKFRDAVKAQKVLGTTEQVAVEANKALNLDIGGLAGVSTFPMNNGLEQSGVLEMDASTNWEISGNADKEGGGSATITYGSLITAGVNSLNGESNAYVELNHGDAVLVTVSEGKKVLTFRFVNNINTKAKFSLSHIRESIEARYKGNELLSGMNVSSAGMEVTHTLSGGTHISGNIDVNKVAGDKKVLELSSGETINYGVVGGKQVGFGITAYSKPGKSGQVHISGGIKKVSPNGGADFYESGVGIGLNYISEDGGLKVQGYANHASDGNGERKLGGGVGAEKCFGNGVSLEGGLSKMESGDVDKFIGLKWTVNTDTGKGKCGDFGYKGTPNGDIPLTHISNVVDPRVDYRLKETDITVLKADNISPTVTATASSTTITVGESTTLSSIGNDQDGSIVSTVWSDQDGNIITDLTVFPLSTTTYTVTVIDDQGASSSATVTITVKAALNNNPDAVNDGPIQLVNNTAQTINVLSNDSDSDSDTLSISGVTNGVKGTVSISGTNVIYTPNGVSSVGTDSFTYTISDGKGGFDTATVSVDIADIPNTAPVAFDGTQSNNFTDSPLSINLNNNGVDDKGIQYSTVEIISQPSNGQLSQNGNTVIYTPVDGTGNLFNDSFTFQFTDAQGEKSEIKTYTITDILDS